MHTSLLKDEWLFNVSLAVRVSTPLSRGGASTQTRSRAGRGVIQRPVSSSHTNFGEEKVAKDALELGNHSSEPEFAILPVHRVCISSSYVCRKVDGGWLQGSAKFGLLDWVRQGSNGRQPRLAMAVQTWLPFFFAAISKAQR